MECLNLSVYNNISGSNLVITNITSDKIDSKLIKSDNSLITSTLTVDNITVTNITLSRTLNASVIKTNTIFSSDGTKSLVSSGNLVIEKLTNLDITNLNVDSLTANKTSRKYLSVDTIDNNFTTNGVITSYSFNNSTSLVFMASW